MVTNAVSKNDGIIKTYLKSLDKDTRRALTSRFRDLLVLLMTYGKAPILPGGGGKNLRMARMHQDE